MKRKNLYRTSDVLTFDVDLNRTLTPTIEKKNNPKKAVIYVRVSDNKQILKWFWLEWQERVCREWCEAQDPPISVDKVYIEPWVSGTTLNRKEFKKCLSYIEDQNKHENQISHFVVSEASRISRPDNISEALMVEEQIKWYGVEIVKVDSPWIDENTDEGALFQTISYAVAGYELKKIAKRASNWRISRLKSGFRPFNKPPLGYVRTKSGYKNYQDNIEPYTAELIREWLEAFAADILETKSDLWRYWNDRGLRANGKTLRRTFPDKVLQLHRLFFYAGYIFYPLRWVSEPFRGQHSWIIHINTVKSIIKKLQTKQLDSKKHYSRWNKTADSFPLKWFVMCLSCQRKYTAWNTTKKVKSDYWFTKKLYPYYWCSNPHCKGRCYIKKDILEHQFEELLNTLTYPTNFMSLLEHVFSEERDFYKQLNHIKSAHIWLKIKEIEKKQEQIQESIIATTNPDLIQSLEQKWQELGASKKNQTSESDLNDVHRIKKLAIKSQSLFTNPWLLWSKSDKQTRQLLFKVRFWSYLTYKKETWLKTSETSVHTCLTSIFLRYCTSEQPSTSLNKTELKEALLTFFEKLSEHEALINYVHNHLGGN